jgi:hypothetical protein
LPKAEQVGQQLRKPGVGIRTAVGLALISSLILNACSQPVKAPPTPEPRPPLSVPAETLENQMESAPPTPVPTPTEAPKSVLDKPWPTSWTDILDLNTGRIDKNKIPTINEKDEVKLVEEYLRLTGDEKNPTESIR